MNHRKPILIFITAIVFLLIIVSSIALNENPNSDYKTIAVSEKFDGEILTTKYGPGSGDVFVPHCTIGNYVYGAGYYTSKFYRTDDGINFEYVSDPPGSIQSMICTESGSILIGVVSSGNYSVLRSVDLGQNWTEVLDLENKGSADYSWDKLGDYIAVTNYGMNANLPDEQDTRKTWFSVDDGVHFGNNEPNFDNGEAINILWPDNNYPNISTNHHMHHPAIINDSGTLKIYIGCGDGVNKKIIKSEYPFSEWQDFANQMHQPISTIYREPYLYWGSDGSGSLATILRHDLEKDELSAVLRTNYPQYKTYPEYADAFTMYEYNGTMYAGLTDVYTNDNTGIAVSKSGENWALLKDFHGDGKFDIIGYANDYMWGRLVNSSGKSNLVKFKPVDIAEITGENINKEAENLATGTIDSLFSEISEVSPNSSLKFVPKIGETSGYYFYSGANPSVEISTGYKTIDNGIPQGETYKFGFWVRRIGNSTDFVKISTKITLATADDLTTQTSSAKYALTDYDWQWVDVSLVSNNNYSKANYFIKFIDDFNNGGKAEFLFDGVYYGLGEEGPSLEILPGELKQGSILETNYMPLEFTDSFIFKPSWEYDSPKNELTIRSYIQDANNHLDIVYSPQDKKIKIIETVNGVGNILSEADVDYFNRLFNLRFILRKSSDGTGSLDFLIGGDYQKLNVNHNNIDFIKSRYGSDVFNEKQADGVFALKEIYDYVMSDEEVEIELSRIYDNPENLNIEFTGATPENNSTQTEKNIPVEISASSNNLISAFIDFNDSIAAWYKMDELNENIVYDYLGKNNAEIIGNATQEQGALGNSIVLDGNSYIKLPSSDEFIQDEFTVSIWAKKINLETGTLFSFGAHPFSPPKTGTFVYWYKTSMNNGKVLWSTYNGTNADIVYSNSNVSGEEILNKWMHFVFVFKNKEIKKMYVNGILQSDINDGAEIEYYSNDRNAIGTLYQGYPWTSLNGSVDDVIIFKRALNENEVSALYADQNSVYLEKNFSDLSEGSYKFKAYVQDINGNIQSTEERNVEIIPDNIYEIDSCYELDNPNSVYYLTKDLEGIEVTNYCMNINAENIILDCQGHLIKNNFLMTPVIYSNGNYARIQNCIIESIF